MKPFLDAEDDELKVGDEVIHLKTHQTFKVYSFTEMHVICKNSDGFFKKFLPSEVELRFNRG